MCVFIFISTIESTNMLDTQVLIRDVRLLNEKMTNWKVKTSILIKEQKQLDDEIINIIQDIPKYIYLYIIKISQSKYLYSHIYIFYTEF
jgi:hypothetical protein